MLALASERETEMHRADALSEAMNHGAEAAQLLIATCHRPSQRPRSRWTEALAEAAVDEAMIAAHWYHLAERLPNET